MPEGTGKPVNARDSYALLDGGEVIAMSVERASDEPGARLDFYLFNEQTKKWELQEQDVAEQLYSGMNRYEEVLRKDPKKAAEMRMRADNKADGENREVDIEQMAAAAPQETARPEGDDSVLAPEVPA